MSQSTPHLDDLRRCTELLEAIAANSLILTPLSSEERIRLLVAAGRVVQPDRTQIKARIKALRRMKRADKEAKDRVVRAATSIRVARLDSVYVPPPKRVLAEGEAPAPVSDFHAPALTLQRPRDCYICKQEFTQVHHFYDSMCPPCAEFNYEKRYQTAPLHGRVAVITGARLKIGQQAALMMLRAGATVVATTRFPQDSALRYMREPDFAEWRDRLHVHGLDLRHSPSVEMFARLLDQRLGRLDILINNAAQTVRRPPGFFAHLMEVESRPYEGLPAEAQQLLAQHEEFKRLLMNDAKAEPPASGDGSHWLTGYAGYVQGAGLTSSAALSQIPYRYGEGEGAEALSAEAHAELFPQGRLDADLQQVDYRKMNSWRMRLDDVPTPEMLEVQLVNSVAPFILCAQLKGLMLRSPKLPPHADGSLADNAKHVVNVSAMEGKFSRHTKTDKHPHTNMAKAALNMMTLTSARDYVRDEIYMNAVDTGWVTDEDPAQLSARKIADHDFQPPLDIVDGAARVCDPFFAGYLTGKHSWGCFLKDYGPTEW